MLRNVIIGLAIAALAASAQPGEPAPAQPSYSMQSANLKPALPGALLGVGIDQRLNQQVPLNLVFRDEFGRAVPLSTYFHGKPVLLALVYYRCPMLCTQILNGVVGTLKGVSFTPGKDFEVLSVSFDPKDTWQLAAEKKKTYLRRYGRAGTANGFHFLTGDPASIKALTDADRNSTTKLLGAMPVYWLDLRGYDPPETAKAVAKPMLFLQGGRDYQVTTEDLESWKKALGGRKDVEFHLYPKLNHLFFEGEGIITPLEYMQKHGSVAPYVIDDIAAWISKH